MVAGSSRFEKNRLLLSKTTCLTEVDKLDNSDVFSCQNKLSQAMRNSRLRMVTERIQ